MIPPHTRLEVYHTLLSGLLGCAAFGLLGGKVGLALGLALFALTRVGSRLPRATRARFPFPIAFGLTTGACLALVVMVPLLTYLETLLRGQGPEAAWGRVRALSHLFKSSQGLSPIGSAHAVLGLVLGEGFFRARGETDEHRSSGRTLALYGLGAALAFGLAFVLGICVQQGRFPRDLKFLFFLHPILLVFMVGPPALLTWGVLTAARGLARRLQPADTPWERKDPDEGDLAKEGLDAEGFAKAGGAAPDERPGSVENWS